MTRYDAIVLGSLDVAQAEALKRRNTQLTPYHLAYGLMVNQNARSHQALSAKKELIQKELESLAKSTTAMKIEDIRPSSELSEWLTLASSEATQAASEEVKEQHLLKYLDKFVKGVGPLDLASENQEEEMPDFLINLSEEAMGGRLDPVIGRTKEIRSVIEILGRRSKNNPILVGPAGVGKTAIVEGLADQIFKGKVPDVLKGKTVFSLDLGSLVAGTKFRGEFEERLKKLLKFIKKGAGEYLLFIDEIHQLVGAGKTDGAMDAANLLKPALARGELPCIGATTPEEFQKYIMGDAALERRLRSVPILEPSKEDATEILMGIRDKQEMHHGIKISDEALLSAVKLSSQYITDKYLPDKAIDLVDEAASSLKLSAEAMPAELSELEAEIRSKRIYAKFEKDKDSSKEIDALEEKFKKAKAIWETEVQSLRKMTAVKNNLDRYQFELEKAEYSGNYEEASKIKYSLIPELEKELKNYETNWVLDESHIANVISRQTKIPAEKILKKKQDKLLELEDFLNSKVFGQEEPLKEISETLLTAYAGLSDPERPLGSFLLMGPTGVGKTETAKALTEFLFDTKENMVRVDLSEYSEKHSVAKLIGAPAGYVGYDEGGILTEAVRLKPYSVILFDEIEKAHEDFSDILLQILDDGRLSDNKGRTIDFKNTIILITTNSKDLHRDFKPEVLGRLDGKLSYKPLSEKIMERLVAAEVKSLNERLKEKNLEVSLSDKTKDALIEAGYDPVFGARPLKAAFSQRIIRPLARDVLKGSVASGALVL